MGEEEANYAGEGMYEPDSYGRSTHLMESRMQ